MIKVKHHTETSLFESLKSYSSTSLILKISGINDSETTYLKVIGENLSQLTHLTVLEKVVKKYSILFEKGYSSLAVAISKLTSLTTLSIKIQRGCLIEGGELGALALSINNLPQLSVFNLHIEQNNMVKAQELRQLTASLYLLPNLIELGIIMSKLNYTKDNCYQSFWKGLRNLQSLRSLTFNLLFQRDEDVTELVNEVIDLSQLENLDMELSEQHGNYSEQFDNLIKIIAKLKNLKNLTVKAPKDMHIYYNSITIEQSNQFLDVISKCDKLEELKPNFFHIFLKLKSDELIKLEQTQMNLVNLKNLTLFSGVPIPFQNKRNLQTLELILKDSKMKEGMILEFSCSLAQMDNLQKLNLYFGQKITQLEGEILANTVLSLQELVSLQCTIRTGDLSQFLFNIRYLHSLQNVNIDAYLRIQQIVIVMESIGHLYELNTLELDLQCTNTEKQQSNISIIKYLVSLQKLKSMILKIPEFFITTSSQLPELEQIKKSCLNLEKMSIQCYIPYNQQNIPPANLFWFEHCPNLKELYLFYRNPIQNLKEQLKFLINLEKLELRKEWFFSYRQLTEMFEGIESMSKLRKLKLSISKDHDQQLDYSFENSLINSFEKLTNLKKVDIYFFCHSDDGIPLNSFFSAFKHIRNLECLKFFYSSSSEQPVSIKCLSESLSNNSNLTEINLNFSNAKLSKNTIKQLQLGLSKLKKLQHVKIEFQKMYPQITSINQNLLNSHNISTFKSIKYEYLNYEILFKNEKYYGNEEDEDHDIQQEENKVDQSINDIQDISETLSIYEQKEKQLNQLLEVQHEIEEESLLEQDRGDITEYKNKGFQELELDLQFTEDNQNINSEVNLITKKIATQNFLSKLSLKLSSQVVRESRFEQNLNIFSLNRLTELKLILNDLIVSEEQQHKISQSPEFFQNLESLDLTLGTHVNIACKLMEGIRHSKNLVSLKITCQKLTNEGALVLGRSLEELSLLKHFGLVFLEYQNCMKNSYSGMNQLIQGINNLNSCVCDFSLKMTSNEEPIDKEITFNEILLKKKNIHNLFLDLKINHPNTSALVEKFIVYQFPTLSYLQSAIIKLNELTPLTQTMFDALMIAAAEQLELLYTLNLEASFIGERLTFNKRIFNEKKREFVQKATVSVLEDHMRFRYDIFFLHLKIQYDQIKEMNFNFWKENHDIDEINLYCNVPSLYDIVFKDLKYAKSPDIYLGSSINPSTAYLHCLLKTIPQLNSVQHLTLVFGSEFGDTNLSMQIADTLSKLDQLRSFTYEQSYDPSDITIKNIIISRTLRLINFSYL